MRIDVDARASAADSSRRNDATIRSLPEHDTLGVVEAE